MTKRQEALLVRLEAWFDAHPHATSIDAARDMHMPPEATKSMVNLGVSAGRFVLVGSEVYTQAGLEALLAKLRSVLGSGPFQPREVREALNAGRAWVEAFADLLSRKGLLDRQPGGWSLKERE